jgi:flagellar protein FliO/FliZ
MTESLVLALRVGFSLMVVLGLMWVAARMLRTKLGTRGSGTIEVLARAQVGRGANVAVLRVADRALVVGVTEHTITLLGEPITDLASLTDRGQEVETSLDGTPQGLFAAKHTDIRSSAVVDTTAGPLRGSLLSPGTWRQAVQAVRDRTVRRG